MKKYSKLLLIFSLLFISITVMPCLAIAQVDPPDGGAGDPDAPIDGGLSLLVAAGIGYGVKKVRDNRKKNTAGLL